MIMRYAWRLLAFSTALMSGCSLAPIANHQPDASPSPIAANAKPLKGRVHGGQQPIQAASIYMFALSNSTYGQASTSLLLSTGPDTQEDANGLYYVTTNSTGGFTIGVGDYACGTTTPQQVYLYSVGGDADFGINTAAGLMSVLGQCTANEFLNLPGSIQMDEVTTVAAAYALAGFATDATDMSGSSTNLAATGMANAAAVAANLADLGTGFALTTTPAGNGTVPQSEINTLADILAACINSAGTGAGSACNTLFANATADGTPTGLQPSDTASAAINIAHHPGANVAALYGLATPTAPFQPILTGASPYNGPNDWTIAVSYTGGGLSEPGRVAVDAAGNIWTNNQNRSSISELSSTGAALSGASGFTGGGLDETASIAIDNAGNAWVTNSMGPSLSEFTSGGIALSGSTGFKGGGLNNPFGLAIDSSGNVWVANYGPNCLSEFNSAGGAISPSTGFTGGGLSSPSGVAIDGSGRIWAGNSSIASLSEFSSTGSAISPSGGYTGGGLSSPYSIAIDASGNIWLPNRSNPAGLSEFNSSGSPQSGSSGYSGGGISHPYDVAVDGSGNVWTVNNSSVIAEVNSAGTAITGSTGYRAGLSGAEGIAIDGSGNLWTANAGSNTVSEFIGVATPVVTPIVAGVINNTLGTRP